MSISINTNTGVFATSVNGNPNSASISMSAGAQTVTLSSPAGAITVSSNGTGDIKVNGEGGFFSADLQFGVSGPSNVSITGLTLSANVLPSWAQYMHSSLMCSATLAPLYTDGSFDGFSGTASCVGAAPLGLHWNSGTYTGQMNSGDFLGLVPGFNILNAPTQEQKQIDQYALGTASSILDSYQSYDGYSVASDITYMDPDNASYFSGSTFAPVPGTIDVSSQDPYIQTGFSGMGDLGDPGDIGAGSYGSPNFAKADMLELSMHAILGAQQSNTNSLLLNPNGDSSLQQMLYYNAMSASLAATQAGFIIRGGPAS